MPERYYLDTSIWIDLYEDRKGYNQEPLGDFAWKLLSLVKARKAKIVISDLLMKELEAYYPLDKIRGMMKPFEILTEKVVSTGRQYLEARMISKERKLPIGDVLHSLIARDYNLILVTRDRHFLDLIDISANYKPEELI